MLQLDAVRRVYQRGTFEVEALRSVSFGVETGEFVSITGQSGSGKSTLLNILGCLDRPTSGVYSLEGVDIGALSEDRRTELRGSRIGFIFQAFHLIPQLTAVENVCVPLFYRRVPKAARIEASQRALERVGLPDRGHHRPSELSGGEQQRVAIARAIAKRPEVLLCDEPTGALDSKTGVHVLAALARVNEEYGTATAVITHNASIADMADRVLFMSDGQISGERRNETRRPPSEISW